MKPPKCTVFQPSTRYREKVVRSVRYDGKVLVIDIQGERFSFARVIFKRVVGFRILEEHNLCEFWPTYSEHFGWLYQVEEGGWLELESTRNCFNEVAPRKLQEYFIVDEECISVLSLEPPEIQDLRANPQQLT